MKVLALDIGAGTEDVLLYDDEKKSIENCVKMVLPSPSQVFANQVRLATEQREDVFVRGDTIGGGALAHSLKRHVERGFRVFMTEEAAFTVRNDLEQVKQFGIEIHEDREPRGFMGRTLVIEEINIDKLQRAFALFGESSPDIDFVAIAVQDHGVFPKGMSNRRFRIKTMRELLKRNPRPEAFAFKDDEIPSYYLRMKSAVQAAKRQLPTAKALLMDTSPDAILGCLKDPAAEKADPILAVNIGNGHTMAAIISSGEIIAVMEHHTRLLKPKKIEQLLIDFADGKLTDEEIFKDNGHGLFYLAEPPHFCEIEKVVATGPNRNILANTSLSVHFATPAGDVMMTGPVGLVEATRRVLLENEEG